MRQRLARVVCGDRGRGRGRITSGQCLTQYTRPCIPRPCIPTLRLAVLQRLGRLHSMHWQQQHHVTPAVSTRQQAAGIKRHMGCGPAWPATKWKAECPSRHTPCSVTLPATGRRMSSVRGHASELYATTCRTPCRGCVCVLGVGSCGPGPDLLTTRKRAFIVLCTHPCFNACLPWHCGPAPTDRMQHPPPLPGSSLPAVPPGFKVLGPLKH